MEAGQDPIYRDFGACRTSAFFKDDRIEHSLDGMLLRSHPIILLRPKGFVCATQSADPRAPLMPFFLCDRLSDRLKELAEVQVLVRSERPARCLIGTVLYYPKMRGAEFNLGGSEGVLVSL